MAVTWIKPIGNHEAVEAGAFGDISLRYKAKTSSAADGPATVLADIRVPRYGDVLAAWASGYPNASQFRCVSRRAVDTDGPRVFEVDCAFSNKFSEVDDKELQPLDRRAKITKQDRDIAVPWLTDFSTGEILKNAAGDLFSPPLTTDIRQSVYTVTFNVDLLASWMTTPFKSVNSTAVVIRGMNWPKRSLLLNSVSHSDEVWEKDQFYFAVTVELIGDFREWDNPDDAANPFRQDTRRLLNDGLFCLPGGNTAKRRRCRVGTQEAQTPQPLDVNGDQIALNDLIADPINAPQWLNPVERPSIDFNSILPPLV